MGFFLFFGLLFVGYSLADWGHYIFKHEPVAMWYLVSGMGTRLSKPGTSSTSTGALAGLGLGVSTNPNNPPPYQRQ